MARDVGRVIVAETALFARRGLPFGVEQKRLLIGKSLAAAGTVLESVFGEPGQAATIAAELEALVGQVIVDQGQPMPGAHTVVELAAARVQVAVASNSSRRLLDLALRRGRVHRRVRGQRRRRRGRAIPNRRRTCTCKPVAGWASHQPWHWRSRTRRPACAPPSPQDSGSSACRPCPSPTCPATGSCPALTTRAPRLDHPLAEHRLSHRRAPWPGGVQLTEVDPTVRADDDPVCSSTASTPTPTCAPDAAAPGATWVGREAHIDGTIVSGQAWPDHPAWMREFLKLLRVAAPAA